MREDRVPGHRGEAACGKDTTRTTHCCKTIAKPTASKTKTYAKEEVEPIASETAGFHLGWRTSDIGASFVHGLDVDQG